MSIQHGMPCRPRMPCTFFTFSWQHAWQYDSMTCRLPKGLAGFDFAPSVRNGKPTCLRSRPGTSERVANLASIRSITARQGQIQIRLQQWLKHTGKVSGQNLSPAALISSASSASSSSSAPTPTSFARCLTALSLSGVSSSRRLAAAA